MNRLISIAFIVFTCNSIFAQSKKQVKHHNLKSTTITIIENGKSYNEKKTVFNAQGNETEITDYDSEGIVETIHKIKYKHHLLLI